jgi:hypothetical protein
MVIFFLFVCLFACLLAGWLICLLVGWLVFVSKCVCMYVIGQGVYVCLCGRQ